MSAGQTTAGWVSQLLYVVELRRLVQTAGTERRFPPVTCGWGALTRSRHMERYQDGVGAELSD